MRLASHDIGDVWYVSVGGATVGPMGPARVVDHLASGSLGTEPVVYRHGFDDWRLMAAVPVFADAYQAWRFRGEAKAPVPQAVVASDTIPLSTHVDFERDRRTPVRVVAREPEPAPRSPRVRVSKLDQPAHEDSVLFSLASLQEQVAVAPPQAPVDDSEIPEFAPVALQAVPVPVAAAPVAPTPILYTPPPRPTPPVGLYVMMFILLAAIGGVTALIILRDTEPVVVADNSADAEHHAASMSRHDEAAATVAPQKPTPKKPTAEAPKPASPKPASSEPAPEQPAPQKPAPEAQEPIAPAPASAEHDVGPLEKPSPDQLRASMAEVRELAKLCGPQHAAAAGTKVAVKLSISGKRGAVISAIAEAPHASDDLGRCVAAALRQATFPKFQRPSLGLLYSVRM